MVTHLVETLTGSAAKCIILLGRYKENNEHVKEESRLWLVKLLTELGKPTALSANTKLVVYSYLQSTVKTFMCTVSIHMNIQSCNG